MPSSGRSPSCSFAGQMYGLAAAIGKIGAFCGTWAFPALINDVSSQLFPSDPLFFLFL